MPFTQAFAFRDLKIPGKSYEHSTFYDAFGYKLKRDAHEEKLTYAMEAGKNIVKKLDYFISILWANEDRECLLDFFGYKLDNPNEWKSNAGCKSWIVKNNLWRRPVEDEEITCEEGTVILGEEALLRRICKGAGDYFQHTLYLKEWNESLKFTN